MEEEYKPRIAGRPVKNPLKKVGTPVRALVTYPVACFVQMAARKHDIPDPPRGLVASDIVRLYVYRGLEHDGLMDEETRNDPTWESLRQKGLV